LVSTNPNKRIEEEEEVIITGDNITQLVCEEIAPKNKEF
jgi:hypothetical protein